MKGDFLFTSESVSQGHPDKVSDQISDAVLDSLLKHDPHARVALETMVTTGLVVLAGEPCPAQAFGSLEGINADYITTDPVSGRKLRLPGQTVAYVDKPGVVTGWVCDDDTDQTLVVRRLDTGAIVPIDPNTGQYRLTVLYSTPGTKFLDLSVTYGIDTRTGTKIIYVRANRPPILCRLAPIGLLAATIGRRRFRRWAR